MKLLVKLADWLSRGIIYTFVLLVLTAAVVSSLFRYYLPQVESHQQDILAYINQHSGDVEISAQRIQSDWQSFKPELSLYGVQVKTPGWDDALHLQKLDLELDILRSLYHRTLYFDHIEIARLELLLVQNAEGRWSLSGMKTGKRQPLDWKKLVERIWAIDELSVHQLYVQLQPFNKARVTLPFLQVDSNTILGDKHVEARLIEGNRDLIKTKLTTQGEPLAEDFQLQAYVQAKDFALFDLLSLLPGDLALASGKLNSEIWLNLQEGQWQLNADLALDDIDIRNGDQRWQVPAIHSRIGVDYDAVIKAWLPDLTILADKEAKPFVLSPVQFSYSDIFQAKLERLDLMKLDELLQHFSLPEKLQQALQGLAPSGALEHVLVEHSESTPFTLKADLDRVSVNAWHGVPGLTNISGQLYSEKLQGKVYLAAEDFSMLFPKLYDTPMAFAQADGEIYWKIGRERLDIGGYDLSMEGEYGQARGEFYLDLPRVKGEGEPPRMSLAIGLKNSAARHRNAFIPKTLDPKLLSWLDSSLHHADIPTGAYIYHGPTIGDTDEIHSNQLWLAIDDGELQYLPEWPAVESIQGEYLLDDKYSFATVRSAITATAPIHNASVMLSPSDDGPLLDVDLQIDSPAAKALTFLQTPVLSAQMGNVLDNWKIPQGRVHGQVSLSTLISGNHTKPQVQVKAALEQVDLQIPEYDLTVQRITGPLVFSLSKGLSSDGLKGRLWKQPLTARIRSHQKTEGIATEIDFSSKLDMRDLQRWSKQPVFALTEGITPVSGQIYYGADGAGLRLASQLKQVAIHLPEPFGKTPDDTTDMALQLPFTGKTRELVAALGKGIDFRFRLGDKGIDAGQVNLGINHSKYVKNKIVVGGQLLTADAEAWIDVVERYQQALDAVPEVSAAQGSDWTLSIEQLRVRTLSAYGQTLEGVSVDLFNTVAYWQLGVDHQNLKASLKIYDDANIPMKAHIHWVDLEFLSDKHEASGIGFTDPQLVSLPDIDFEVDKLIWNGDEYGDDFGEWAFQLRTYVDHMALENIESSFRGMRIGPNTRRNAELSWSFGDDAQTRFIGRFAGDNLADALKAWGYSQEVNSQSAWFDVDVNWQGGPMAFAMNRIEGESQFELLQGNFADAKSGSTGALKLIGVLNLARIIRRLKLDFSDLSKTGLAYDSLKGRVRMKGGVFNFYTPMVIKGASSDIRFQGLADINTEQLDMSMGVTLPLASNLPWLVAMAGGLPTAAGVYIISKLLKKQVDKLSSVVYRVEGSFSDPQLEFMKLFDDALPETVDLRELDLEEQPSQVDKLDGAAEDSGDEP